MACLRLSAGNCEETKNKHLVGSTSENDDAVTMVELPLQLSGLARYLASIPEAISADIR